MFETVVPPRRAGGVWKTLTSLPVSLTAHAIVIAGATLYTLSEVSFPTHYPSLMTAYSLAEAPPPPPPPPPPAAARSVTAQQTATQVPTEIVAPTMIPDQIPVLTEMPFAGVTAGIDQGVAGGVVGGDPNGVAGGVVGGAVGGVIGGIVEESAPPDTVVIKRDATLPMVALSQTYPSYPEDARVKRQEDSLVVRYIIGKSGRVRFVEVISAPQQEIFAKATVRAIRFWRFKPMIVEGEAKEVVHELTVHFRLEYEK